MRSDKAVAVCLALVAGLGLVACGADDEPSSSSRVAATTTVRTPAASTTAAAATTPAAATSGTGAGTIAGTGVPISGANAQDIACQNASGTRTAQDPDAVVDATTTPTAATTTPDGATTTPADAAVTPEGATTTPGDAGVTPAGATTTPAGATTTPEGVTTTPADPTAQAGATTTPGAATTTPEATPAGGTSTTAGSGSTAADETAANGAVTADQVALARPFSSTSPWNTPVDTRAADSRSEEWIAKASRRVAVVASENRRSVATTERTAPDLRLYVNTCAWTPTIVGEDGGETVRVICRQRNCGPVAKEVKTLRVTPGVDPFPEFDGWFSVIDQSAGVGYDMWRARRVGDVISYQFIKRWPLNGPGFSAPAIQDASAAVGARGSGLPLFAGVIQPSELRQGRIDHALAISVPGPAQRIFTQPASVTNGINVIDSLPEGARLRLKSSFTPGKLPRGANERSAETIITALRTYGAIVVDRSITPTLYARRSTNYGTLLVGNELQGIKLSDLEVVQSGTLLRFPPLETTPEAVQG